MARSRGKPQILIWEDDTMSKYDNIETVAELIAEVQANGLSTEIEDLASAQEILDSSGTEELIRFIAFGAPKQEGTVSLSAETPDPEHMAFDEVKADNARLRAPKVDLEDKVETLQHEQEMATREIETLRNDERSMISALESAESEIVTLKAELYDYIKAMD